MNKSLQTEADLVPYRAESVLPARRVLVLAPHPDDEVFGCGACTRLHVLAGARVDVVVLTDGSGGGEPKVREAESEAAARILGTAAPHFWAYKDRELAHSFEASSNPLTQRLVQLLIEVGHEVVYAPSPWEVHPDHRATARAVAQAVQELRSRGAELQWAAYEVGTPLWPSRLVNIDAVWADKEAAMRCFMSQLSFQKYDEHISALNRYRSYTISGQCSMAEALWLPRNDDLAWVIQAWNEGKRHPGPTI